MKNPFDILAISPRAEPEVIRAAYRALAQKYHPDRNPGVDARMLNRKMAELNWAKEELDRDLDGWRQRILGADWERPGDTVTGVGGRGTENSTPGSADDEEPVEYPPPIQPSSLRATPRALWTSAVRIVALAAALVITVGVALVVLSTGGEGGETAVLGSAGTPRPEAGTGALSSRTPRKTSAPRVTGTPTSLPAQVESSPVPVVETAAPATAPPAAPTVAPLSVGGVLNMSGDSRRVTDNFCVTANVLAVAYRTAGTGEFPEFYHFNVSLYTDSGGYVDSVIGVKGSGTLSLRTDGPGCYYLELDPYNATWAISVNQSTPADPPPTGGFSLSGDSRIVTDNFCVTASVLTVSYSTSGTGEFPEFYHFNVSLYTDSGGYVDSVIGVKGSGTLSLRTDGPGCYYLELDPYSATWTITVGE